MEKISDTVTSVFHVAIKDKRPAVCSSTDGAIVWSEPFGLGWRFGISCNPQAWFPKVRLYLEHTQTKTEQDQAVVTISLKETADKDAMGFKEREATIVEFGHGQPALLGSWSPSDFALRPYVFITLTTKARLPPIVTNPLSSTSVALRQSLESGDFADTKFYVFSTKRTGTTAGKPRVVYANSNSLGFALPKTASSTNEANATREANVRPPAFLVNMTCDNHINRASVLHQYEYEQDSDLDDDDSDDVGLQRNASSSRFRAASSTDSSAHGTSEDDFSVAPPAYSISNCRIVLVKGVAYKTWLAYIYFRYTGQVSFRSLKSARGSHQAPANNPNQAPSCSPKSMYRLAATVGDEAMKDLAYRAIKEGLSKDNIVEEAFSWFTAQYPCIGEYEVEKVFEFRKLPEIVLGLKFQMKLVSLGEKPWADGILIAIMDKLNTSEPSI